MFDLSFGEMVLALVVAFVIFGPERFPVMLREAIGWIKKVKNMAFEAQQSLDHLGKSIKDELPDPNSWSPSNGDTENPYNSRSDIAIEPIKIDRNPSNYEERGHSWRTYLEVDRLQEYYSTKPLDSLPWREKPLKPSPDPS